MTVRDAITGSGLERADAEVLLATLLHKNRAWLIAHGEEALTPTQEAEWNQWKDRRTKGEPVAYITGSKEFFGRTFTVTPSVLIPRPATERLVELALETLEAQQPHKEVQEIDSGIAALIEVWGEHPHTIVDIGTGSGCIAITLALELRDQPVIATDISPEALVIAKQNAAALGARNVEFRLGSGFAPLMDLREPFLIVSNPPYIPAGMDLERDVLEFEPDTALFGGTDGADLVREIVRAAHTHPQCIGYLIECRMEQARALLD